MTVCVAGQNNIAIEFLEYLLAIKETNSTIKNIIACCNKNDNGVNGFNRSYKLYCQLNNIEIKSIDNIYKIKNLVFFSVEFDQIIDISKFSSKKLYNIHFSLLPEYKGMYTSALPILHGKKITGVTLHHIDKGIDTGDIIYQKKIVIKSDMTCEQLYRKYTKVGLSILKNNFKTIVENKYRTKEQKKENSTYFSKKSINYDNLEINLRATAYQIKNQIRAFYFPSKQVPTIYLLPIYKCEILSIKPKGKIGEITEKNKFYIHINSIDYQIKLHLYLLKELLDASKTGDLNILNEFINNNYDIYQRNKNGWDILIVAVYNGQLSFVKYLVEELKWDLNTINNNGTNILMYAFSNAFLTKKTEILEYVLNLKKNSILKQDYFNKSVYDYAKEKNNAKLIGIIKKYL